MTRSGSTSADLESLERLLCMLEVRLNAVGVCQIGDGLRLQLPGKQDVLIHYIVKGNGTITVSDGSSIAVGTGALVFVPPGMDQELACGSHDGDVVSWRDAAHAFGDGMMKLEAGSGSSLVSVCGLIAPECAGLKLFESLHEAVLEDVSAYSELLTAFALVLRELERPRLGARTLTEAIMKQALVIALRCQMERNDVSVLPIGVADPRLLKALIALVEQPAQEHRLEQLAQLSGMGRSLFAESFAETFGRPPIDLLKHIRLRRAADLLRNTELPIQVVAAAVGYGSRSYFSRAFRAAYRSDPKGYRHMWRPRREPRLDQMDAGVRR